MKNSVRINHLIVVSSLFLAVAGSAEENEQLVESNSPQDLGVEEPIVALRVGTVDADSVRDAGIALRLKEAAQLYFYPKEFRSIVSLFGYPVENIQGACAHEVSERTAEAEVGRIARIIDDSAARTRAIISMDYAAINTLDSKHSLSVQTFEKLCNSLKDLSNVEDEDRLVIATENPIPSLESTHRYLIESLVLTNGTSPLESLKSQY